MVWLWDFFCVSFVFLVYVAFCFIVFGCQYQCSQLPGKTYLQNDLLCVECNVKPYTLTHSVTYGQQQKMLMFEILLHVRWCNNNICIVFTVSLSVGFSALVAVLWCIGAWRCQRSWIRSRGNVPWKQAPTSDVQMQTDGARPLLIGEEDEEDVA